MGNQTRGSPSRKKTRGIYRREEAPKKGQNYNMGKTAKVDSTVSPILVKLAAHSRLTKNPGGFSLSRQPFLLCSSFLSRGNRLLSGSISTLCVRALCVCMYAPPTHTTFSLALFSISLQKTKASTGPLCVEGPRGAESSEERKWVSRHGHAGIRCVAATRTKKRGGSNRSNRAFLQGGRTLACLDAWVMRKIIS